MDSTWKDFTLHFNKAVQIPPVLCAFVFLDLFPCETKKKVIYYLPWKYS